MKKYTIAVVFIFLIILSSCGESTTLAPSATTTPVATMTPAVTKKPAVTITPAFDPDEVGMYFGQKPPGMIPEVFAPGFISTPDDMEYACTYTPDGKEFYYSVNKGITGEPVIMVSRWKDGKWTVPEKLNVQAEGLCTEPHVTRDGQTLYFGGHLTPQGEEKERRGIWQLKRDGDSWSGLSYVTDGMYATTTEDGSIYLTDVYGTRALVKLPFNGTGFDEPIVLEGGPNSPVRGVHPCVAPDESFIIFDHDRPDGSEGDLFVSFNNGDGTWSESYSLGDTINSSGIEFCASLSPDGKYLFFMKDFDIYWVDIKIIDQFRSTGE